MIRLLLVLVMACGVTRKQRVDPPQRPTPFCFASMTEGRDGTTAVWRTCAEWWNHCLKSRDLAIRFGNVVGLKKVGNCYHVP